jgi:hypothetical protein
MATTLSRPISLIPLVAVLDAGYGFGQLTSDAATVADINAVITMNGDCSTKADFVRHCSCG